MMLSCRKCKEGCDIFYTVHAGALNISDTVVSLNKSTAITTIAIDKVVSKDLGDRNCKYESEISCNRDELNLNNLSIYCNKELIVKGKIYPMNTDLLEVQDLIQYPNTNVSKLPFIVLQTTSDFPAGRYHFLLQGTTEQGKQFEDIAVISWE